MTVKELIDKLSKYPADKKVWLETEFYNSYYGALYVGDKTLGDDCDAKILDTEDANYAKELENK